MRCFARWAPLAAVLAAPAARAQALVPPAQSAPTPFRVEYAAPATCPGEAAFLALVRSRVGTSWEAAPGAPARLLAIHVVDSPSGSRADLSLEADQGPPIARTVTAGTCSEVVSGIALVTALAIEARVAPAPGEPTSVVAPPPGTATDAASSGTATAAPAPAPVPPPPPPPPPPSPPPSRPSPPPHLDVAVSALVVGGVGPEISLGLRAGVGLGWDGGPDFRLVVDTATTGDTTDDTRFTLLAATLLGCPIAFSLVDSVQVLPCAGFTGGRIQVDARGNDTYEGSPQAPGWAAALVALRLDAAFGPLFVELGSELRFPFGYKEFVIVGKEEPVYQVPRVAGAGTLGVGFRL